MHVLYVGGVCASDARRQTDLITIVNGINGISNGGRREERTAEGSSLPNWNPIGTSSGVIKMNLALVQFKAAKWREFRGTLDPTPMSFSGKIVHVGKSGREASN